MTRSTRAIAVRWSWRMRDLALASFSAQRLLSSLPPGHEMIGRQDVEEQLAGVAFKFTENV